MSVNFITLSLETHLFFARIMKEHSLFLQAGFPCQNEKWIQKADYFRQAFEELLSEAVEISGTNIRDCVLASNELVTEYTMPAEKMTMQLSGIPINMNLTERQLKMTVGSCDSRQSFTSNNTPRIGCRTSDRELYLIIQRLNQKTLNLLRGLVEFKEAILQEVKKGRLYTANYPLLIQHILREAKLYLFTLENLMNGRNIPLRGLPGTEGFWNQIMMEHALFIRGLLDPSEEALVAAANEFALDYKKLMIAAGEADQHTMPRSSRGYDSHDSQNLTGKTLEKTREYQKFKTAGTQGILNCEIASIILPLLGDHVLREANHYIRLLESD